jgi:hypothetical protein
MCNGLQIYQEDVDHHYKTSPMHALCTVCDVGFEDKEALNQVRQEASTLRFSSQIKADITLYLMDRSTLMRVTPDSGVDPVIFPLVRQPF